MRVYPGGRLSTYVGGSAPCLNALINDPGLEILPIQIDQPIDPGSYPA